jgi:cobaltochelatase CobT
MTTAAGPNELAAVQAAWQRTYAGDRTADLTSAVGPVQTLGRGTADAFAAWQRWHPSWVDTRISAAERPWYAILERARVETLASRDLPGMALNLSEIAGLAPADPQAASLYRLARQLFAEPIASSPASDAGTDDTFAPLRGVPVARAPSEARIASRLGPARLSLADAAAFAERVLPLVRELALAAVGDTGNPSSAPVRPGPAPLPTRPKDAEGDAMADDARTPPDSETETPPAGTAYGVPADRRYPGYAIYATRWDETLDAAQLYRPGDAGNLRQIPEADQRQARRLALRLQRRLLAARLRRWSFDQDEGRLDSRRLTRLLTRRPPYAIFRQEDEAPLPEACVTLLVDQSGSMRGLPQRLAAQAIDLAVRTLEIGGIRGEVLGYTTRYGPDNPLVRAWQAAGRPAHPGRLNALRHLVYKRADQPWRHCRAHLGLLLREGLGRENLDGEALDWAARRLLARPEPRKVLIVLCDGVPADEATEAANGREFLEAHLRAVIAALESSPILLAAIGAGRTVGRFYRQALTLHQPNQVAELLFQHLGDLFIRPPGQGLA